MRRGARDGKQRIEFRRVEAGVVQRPARLPRLEHRAEKCEADVARNAGDEHVERLVRRARLREKRAQLHLSNVDANAARAEIGLHELLERVVAAADGEEIELERAPAAARESHRAPRVQPAASNSESATRVFRDRLTWRGRADSLAAPDPPLDDRIRRAPH